MKKYSWFVRHTAQFTTKLMKIHKEHSDGFRMTKDIELIIIMLTIIVTVSQLNSKAFSVTPIKSFIILNVIGWGLVAFIAIILGIITFVCWAYQTYMNNVHNYLKEQQKN